jgi:Zn-dependent protease with chaperone function
LDEKEHRTDAAYDAARTFAREQANSAGELPQSLSGDALAWYFLGSAYLYDWSKSADVSTAASRAERALRRSLELDGNFARAHGGLALALWMQDPPSDGPRMPGLPQPGGKSAEATKEMARAHELDPSMNAAAVQATAALCLKRFAQAEKLFTQALREQPHDVEVARGAAQASILNPQREGDAGPAVKRLLDQFPDDGVLVCLHGVALAADDKPREALRELDRARRMGTDPSEVLPPQVIAKIEENAAPGLTEYAIWTLVVFVAVYAVWMLLMAGVGVVLAARTRGHRIQETMESPDDLIHGGQVARTQHESWLARLYTLMLFASLILFYIAMPFLIVGLIAGTGLLLYLIFMLPRIPLKLIIVVVVVGLGGAWAVFKSLFARPTGGSFGIPKTAEQCPRLHQMVNEVAARVDTEPLHEIYLAPGAAIGVHQEGRGPFGIFGVSRRVLTLGVSTLRFLTVGELQAILAHEYAHFSHKDTFYNRFVYQVTLSIQEAVNGMGRTGGWYTYLNPILWFLLLYYKAYGLLSAGFSRSREFLADRMAAGLYGSDVFKSALTKVATDGTLFEMTMYQNISQLLSEDKAFVNMYEAFHKFRDEQLGAKEREELYQKLLDEKPSLFASHPTFAERIAAIETLPRADNSDTASALTLCDNAEEVEKELTEFLTGYIYHVSRLQAQAAAAN